MRIPIIVCAGLFLSLSAAAQVGINTSSPDPSAVLDIVSASGGVLMPRLTNEERDAIISPAAGLIIFNTTTGCLNYRLDSGWYQLCGECIEQPSIVSHPVDAISCESEAATFGIEASGHELSFQWQVSTNGGSSWNNIFNSSEYSGTDDDTLHILDPAPDQDGYQYRVHVSGCAQTITSSPAELTIAYPTTASAGEDVFAGCGGVVLSANAPGLDESGVWTVTSGQVSGYSFSNSQSSNSTFSGQNGQVYTLRWTLNSSCGESFDEVLITFGIPSGLQSGIVGYYPFCGNADDISGNGYHGAVNGAIPTTDRFGMSGNAYAFDGVNDHITASNAAYKSMGAHTVAVYIKREGIGSDWPRIFLNGGVNTGITITQNGSAEGFLYRLSGVGSCGDLMTQPAMDNSWKHFVFTYDGSMRKVYVNGTLFEQSAASCSTTGSGNLAYFGGDNGSSIQGAMDEIMIWNRALSAAEISQLYGLISP